MCCNCCSVRQQKIWVFTLGSLFSILGVVLITAWPSVSQQIIRGMMPLAPNSFLYKYWVTTPTPIYTKFYLFNWTNPEDINNVNVKPNSEELGPYVFNDYKVKEDLVWDKEKAEVTYFGRRTWHFMPELSNGSLDDVVVTPNFATVTAARYVRKYRRIVRKAMNFALDREGGTKTFEHTAGEWMFDGFYDRLVDFVERLHSPLLPIYSDHFGWFYMRNNSKTAEGNFTIHTGHGDLSQLGELKMWNGSAHTGLYEGECGRVNGSTGDLWAPGRNWEDTISIFLSDAARFINLYAQEKVKRDGVDAWRYETTNLTFDNGQISPDTKCFCVPGRVCPKNGMVDFSPAAYKGPVYMSHPHFYLTDPMYRENITGLNPQADKQGMYLIMEPTLGIPMKLKGQVMASVLIERDEEIDLLKDIAYNHYAPLFSVALTAELEGDMLRLLKFGLNVPAIGQYIGIALLIIGLIMLAVGICLTRQHRWHNELRPEQLATPLPAAPAANTLSDKVQLADDKQIAN